MSFFARDEKFSLTKREAHAKLTSATRDEVFTNAL